MYASHTDGQTPSHSVFERFFPVSTTRSPLRYPGGKSRAVSVIQRYIPPVDEMISPFIGGGSVELFCASRGIRVHAFDGFKPVAVFWKVLLSQPRLLVQRIRAYHPLNAETYEELKHHHREIADEIEMAAQYFVLNRASFSGITTRGRISPSHPRFTAAIIDRLESFRSPNLSVEWADFRQSLKRHPSVFCYADPPYVNKSRLYGEKGGRRHTDFDHVVLAEILKNRSGKWLVSYNDCDEIRNLYSGYCHIEANWTYGIRGDGQSREILIANYDLLPI